MRITKGKRDSTNWAHGGLLSIALPPRKPQPRQDSVQFRVGLGPRILRLGQQRQRLLQGQGGSTSSVAT